MPIPFLAPDDKTTAFPPVERALKNPNGLLMAGGSLDPQRLWSAYQQGIFPWYEEGEPILWWSPDPRCVLWPAGLRVSRSLQKSLRNGNFEVTVDRAFREVIEQCAATRPGASGTWITRDMIQAYCRLHRYGAARSVEVWRDQRLVGGLYGIVMSRVFVGESMFSRVSDASKVALVHLARDPGISLIDCQLDTPHLLGLGAQNIPRSRYLELLRELGAPDANPFRADNLDSGDD